jgi:hypothetical protein
MMNQELSPNSAFLYRILTSPVTLAVGIATVLMLTMTINSPSFMRLNEDEGIWFYIGRVWLSDNIPPYVGTSDNKTPAIFLVFGLSNLLAGVTIWLPRLIGVASMVGASVVLYFIAQRLLSREAGAIAMCLFGLTMAWGLMDGPYTAQTESFLVLLVSAGFFCLIIARSTHDRKHLALLLSAGLCVGMAINFKEIAVTSAAALSLFCLFEGLSSQRSSGQILRDLTAIVAGILLAIGLSLLPLLASGVSVAQYWQGAWLILLEPGTGNPNLQNRIQRAFATWMRKDLLWLYLPLLVFIVQKRSAQTHGIPYWGILAWLALEFAGTNASGFYYGHHLKQVMPPLAIASGLGIALVLERWRADALLYQKIVAAVLICLVIVYFPYYIIRWPPGLVHLIRTEVLYQKARWSGSQSEPRDHDEAVGLWLKTYTSAEDYVYLWGTSYIAANRHAVLAYSQRRAPTKYFHGFLLERPGAISELESDFARKPPRIILVPADAKEIPLWLQKILVSYSQKEIRDDWRVFQRN